MLNIEKLKARGYCVVSRKFRMLARIDRPDWKQYMAKKQSPWDPEGDGMAWVKLLGEQAAEDHYRRVYSRDTIEPGLTYEQCRDFPKSGETVTGYVA